MSSKNKTRRKGNKKIYFHDYPDFKPNLTPKEIFSLGSFGGTYWRPIKSKFLKNTIRHRNKRYPAHWWNKLPDDWLFTPFDKYDKSINKYGVKVGTTLKFWENKGWIKKSHPYGWVDWYCDFYEGKRSSDDERQISRWKGVAGTNGRFMKYLVTLILKKNKKWNDTTVSPKIRQTLQHWGYKLTKRDFLNEVKKK
jgi:hypothetical protein